MLYPAELRARLFLRSKLFDGPDYQSWLAGATLRIRKIGEPFLNIAQSGPEI
jgi:hypothetical protein